MAKETRKCNLQNSLNQIMKRRGIFGLLLLMILTLALTSQAQETKTAAERSIALRLQLLEVQAQIEPLLLRARELEDALKPESIDQFVAVDGSTRPEELRDYLQRRFSIEQNAVLAQLKALDDRRGRLESEISVADLAAAKLNNKPGVSVSSVETVRGELLEIEIRINALQARLQQLDYELKPENIERALSGIGSTRPEELREQRRRLIVIERETVLEKLKLLEEIHSRLEVMGTPAASLAVR